MLCAGTVFVSEDSGQLCLNQLSSPPEESCDNVMRISHPDLRVHHPTVDCRLSATWAPDDTKIALKYSLEARDHNSLAMLPRFFQVDSCIHHSSFCIATDALYLSAASESSLLQCRAAQL